MTVLQFFGRPAARLVGPAAAVSDLRRLWAAFVQPAPEESASPADPAPRDRTALPQVDATDPVSASALLNRLAIEMCPHPAVHAGVVSLAGAGVAIPAVSGAGKSTLVTTLCRAGAGYVSDEALVMADGGRALPYAKPVALSGPGMTAAGLAVPGRPGDDAGDSPADSGLGEHLLAPAGFAMTVSGPLVVEHLILPQREAGGPTRARLDEVPRREGLAALLALSFNHYRDPPRFLTTAAALVAGAQVWRLRYRESARAVSLMAQTLSLPTSPQ